MEFQPQVMALLNPLVGGRAYANRTPPGVKFPCIIFQIVGGDESRYVDKQRRAAEHVRLQVHVWAGSTREAEALARKAADALCESNFAAVEPYGRAVWLHNEALDKDGTRQDFGIWHTPD